MPSQRKLLHACTCWNCAKQVINILILLIKKKKDIEKKDDDMIIMMMIEMRYDMRMNDNNVLVVGRR